MMDPVHKNQNSDGYKPAVVRRGCRDEAAAVLNGGNVHVGNLR